MAKKSKSKKKTNSKKKKGDETSLSIGPNRFVCSEHKGPGAFYGLGFLGSAIYYVSTATGFWNGVWGIVKSVVWPAFLVFEVLKFVGA